MNPGADASRLSYAGTGQQYQKGPFTSRKRESLPVRVFSGMWLLKGVRGQVIFLFSISFLNL